MPVVFATLAAFFVMAVVGLAVKIVPLFSGTARDLLRVITCDTMTFNTQNVTFYIIFQQWAKNSILPGTR